MTSNPDSSLIAACMTLIERYEGRFNRAYDYGNRRKVGIGFDLDRPEAGGLLADVGLDYSSVRAGEIRLSDVQIDALLGNELKRILRYARQKLPRFDREPLDKKAVIAHVIFDYGCRDFERLDNRITRLNGGCQLLASRSEDSEVSCWHHDRSIPDTRCRCAHVLNRTARGASARSAGFLTQGHLGRRGNFELLVPHSEKGVAHYWRDNDNPTFPWFGPVIFAATLGKIDRVAVIESQLEGTATLESLVLFGNELAYYWREGSPYWAWHGPITVATGVSGSPCFVRCKVGMGCTLDVVVPLEKTGIAHYRRSDDGPASPWSGRRVFGCELGHVDGVTATQSNLGNMGTLEVVARAGDRLVHYWRGEGSAEEWQGPIDVCGRATGIPAVIQGRHGLRGNLELVAPLQTGGIAHLWCNNDSEDFEWTGPTAIFGTEDVLATSLLQSNFGSCGLGNLEVAAWDGRNIRLYWRHDDTPWTWQCSHVLRL
jgi:hypothetical protein